MCGKGERDRAVARAELLGDERRRERVQSRAAVLRRHAQAGEPERGELGDEVEGHDPGFAPAIGVRCDPGAYEVPDRVPHEELIVAVAQVH